MFSKIIVLFIFFSSFVVAEELSPEKKKSLMEQIEKVKIWGTDKKIVDAVKEANQNPKHEELTQEKWEKLSVLDPSIREFTKNPVAELLTRPKVI